jgi:nucleotide-binding universal stress UspA family protein
MNEWMDGCIIIDVCFVNVCPPEMLKQRRVRRSRPSLLTNLFQHQQHQQTHATHCTPLKMPYTIAVALQNDPSCHDAIRFAFQLCQRMKRRQYRLMFVQFAPTNPEPSVKLPVIDRLERGFNEELHEEARRDMLELVATVERLSKEHQQQECCVYEYVKVEQASGIHTLLRQFVNDYQPHMFVLGSHRQSPLKKLVFGWSVSQWCVDELPCAVVVVKPKENNNNGSSGSSSDE